jgi:hypothetical protein
VLTYFINEGHSQEVVFLDFVHNIKHEIQDLSFSFVGNDIYKYIYSAFFLTVAIGNCMVKLLPPVNFCSDENIQTIFGTKLEDFLNYRIVYNSIS